MRDTVLTINVVEQELIHATNLLSAKLGYKLNGVVLVDKKYIVNSKRPRDKSGLFKEIICDFDNPDEIQIALKPYVHRIFVATVRFESTVQSFKKILPFIPYCFSPTESSMLWSTDKSIMRKRLSCHDQQLVPKFFYVEDADFDHIEEIMRNMSFPVIVKPTALAASLLVTRCNDINSLKSCIQKSLIDLEKIYKHSFRDTKPGLLIEEFMEGPMYSTDAYVTPTGEVYCLPLVEVITAESIGLPGYYSYRHIIPTGLEQSEIDKAFDVARASLHALGLRSTSAHIELFKTLSGWKIIEVGARIGGYRHDLYSEAYGINHFYNDLLVRSGQEPIMPNAPICHAAGMNIYAESEGIIKSINGIDEARNVKSVVWLEVHAQTGDSALFADKGGKLIVDGILSNPDKDQLELDVQRVRELINIEII